MAPTEVDPRFRQMGRSARRRRRKWTVLRWGAGMAFAGLAGGLLWYQFQPDLGYFWRADDQEMVQVESQFDIAPVVRADTFTDLPGDPLIIPALDEGAARDVAQTPMPAALAGTPRLAGAGSSLTVLDSDLMPRGMQLVANLPSTREEFALFQAERSRGRFAPATQLETGVAIVPADQRATSSVSFLRDAVLRTGLWRELLLEAARDVAIKDLLAQNGFDVPQADQLAQRIEAQLGLEGPLSTGSVLALRYRLRGASRQVIQVTLIDPEGYVGSLALSSAGQLVPSADAWADQDLLETVLSRGESGQQRAGQQRLLDLIYSVALRNDIKPEVVGEAISMMARVYDLDSMANENDRLTMILANEDAARPGAVLFVGISGPGGDKPCYVVPAESEEGFECYAPSARIARPAGGLDLQSPIAGVLSQRFVPPAPGGKDSDPSRGRVAWSAPAGTRVAAAGDGKITARQTESAAGASVEITHSNGMVSRYSGLATLADEAVDGADIAKGMALGTVGAAKGGEARLIFQLLSDGNPVDPMPYLSGAGEVLASDAVESLIGRIITVESAGNARAQNPLSSATGLGQFIESTWLRMIRSYRPELAGSLDRRAQLDLRFDPDLSRQMVRHLAQENEAYLRVRGHAITPGRLYLAHFLGPAGADVTLRADPSASVLQVMGPAVVSANPFLRGYSIADLRNWAERKMNGASAAPHIPAEISIPAEIRAYVEAVDRLRQAENG